MAVSLRFTAADLTLDGAVCLRCGCRARAYPRADLTAPDGRDARLGMIGLRPELRRRECGEPAFHDWTIRSNGAVGA
jgi:hypothetical protein